MKAMARKHMAVRAALLRVTMSLALAVGFFGAMLVSGTQRDNAEAAPALTDAVWRVQIQFQTGSEPGAGTDDNVAVSLNPQSVTVIDSPINDFEYQQSGTYDLKFRGATGGAATFNDLQYVTVGHRGDPWCLRSYSVIVNNAWAFYKSFSGEPDYCKWLGDGQAWSTTRRQWVAVLATVSAASTEIRSGGFWFYYAQPRLTFPMTIGRAELTKRAEMAVGDMMRAIWTSYGWGNDSGSGIDLTNALLTSPDVGCTHSDGSPCPGGTRIRIHAHMHRTVSNWLGDDRQNVDQFATYALSCSAGRLIMTAIDSTVTISGQNIASQGTLDRTALPGAPSFGEMNFGTGWCRSIIVQSDGSVTFDFAPPTIAPPIYPTIQAGFAQP